MKLSYLIDSYLKHLVTKDVSSLTYRDYSHYLNRLLTFSGDIEISGITKDKIEEYKKFLKEYFDEKTGLSLKRVTQNYMLIALRGLIEFAREKSLTELTKKDVPLFQLSREPTMVLEKKDIDTLLNLPDPHTKKGLRDKTILETLFSTGLLVSELSSLNKDSVDQTNKTITLSGKSGKERMIYLFDRCAYWLTQYLTHRIDNHRPLFIRYQGLDDPYQEGERMRLTTRSIERIVEKYAKALGLRGKITPQSFRHFLAVSLLKEGVDQKTVGQILGHSSTFSTNEYIKNLKEKNES